jgi:glucosyl-3-phosphoglycerate synthase
MTIVALGTDHAPTKSQLAAGAVMTAIKGGLTIAACIPARNESTTIEPIVSTCSALADIGFLDEIVIVDDGSTDDTAVRARRAGADVIRNDRGRGKGQALCCGVAHTRADVVVFLDGDVSDFSSRFVTQLVAPLLAGERAQMVKAAYRRPLDGQPEEGGRVTELVARPLLERFYPELAGIAQPLSGECAIRRRALEAVTLADGYGIEIGLLIDIYSRFGIEAIAEVDLDERIHRNRPLHQLRPHARDVLDAVMSRVALARPQEDAHE